MEILPPSAPPKFYPLPLASSDILTRDINTVAEFEELLQFMYQQREVIDVNITISKTANECNIWGNLIKERITACRKCIAKFPAVIQVLEDYQQSRKLCQDKMHDFSR